MRIILLLNLLLHHCLAYSQTSDNKSLELSFQIRQENLADYTTRFGTVFYQNSLKLNGTSTGLDLGFKMLLKKHWFVKPHVGYYKFNIDKIINHRIPSRATDPSNYRPIDYSFDSLLILYGTSKYHYNNISLSFAFGRIISLKNDFSLTTDFNFTYLHSFSQHYEVKEGYTTSDNRNFGYLIDYRIGLEKKLKKIYLAPALIVPVYKKWKQDIVFKENPDKTIDKWFGGCGVSVTIGKYIN